MLNGGLFIFNNANAEIFLTFNFNQELDDYKTDFMSIDSSGALQEDGGIIHVTHAKTLYIGNIQVVNTFVSGGRNGSFLYSTSKDLSLQIKNVKVICSSNSSKSFTEN